jgi:hypothetical protein
MTAAASNPPSKSFTSQKLDLQRRIGADRRVTDGQFRMFVRVLGAMNERTGVAVIGDETIMAEVPSCGSPSTCKVNRRNLQELGYWRIKPGSGSRTTEYAIDLTAGMHLVAGLDDLRAKRIQRRRQTTEAWRARKAAVRHGDVGLQDAKIDHAVRHGDVGVVRHGDVGQSVMQDPPYTLRTPSTDTPSHSPANTDQERAIREADFALASPSTARSAPDGPEKSPRQLLIEALGDGDVRAGRLIADALGPQRCAFLTQEIADVGPWRAAAQIREAAADVRARLMPKQPSEPGAMP